MKPPPIHAGMSREEYERAVSQKDKAMSNEGVDVGKLQVWDVVRVRAQITHITHHDGKITDLRCLVPDGGGTAIIDITPADIVSIEPRPIAVGDRASSPDVGPGLVIAIHEGRVWLRTDDYALDKLVPLATLTPAGAADEQL